MKTKNLLCFVLFFLFLIVPICAQKEKPTFQSKVELVNVNFRVTNKDGDLVTGLSDEDFEVYENGIKQVVTNFASLDGPVTTVLLIDYSKQSVFMSAYSQQEIWFGPLEFVKSRQEEDWTAILMYDRKVYNEKFHQEAGVFQDFTQNKQDLEKTLMKIFRDPPAWSESCLVDAVKTVLGLISDNRESLTDKISIVLVSTGLDTFSKNLYDQTLKEAQNSGVVIYAVSVGQQIRLLREQYLQAEDRLEFLSSDNRLKSFAELTGGQAFFPRFAGEFRSIFENISNGLRNQYSLGYISNNTKRDGKFRKIEVKVNKTITNKKGKEEKLNASHRKGYYAPKD